jgi:hypothetical protein
LYERHLKSVDPIGGRATQDDGVVFFDFLTKISVGSNPWAAEIVAELKE